VSNKNFHHLNKDESVFQMEQRKPIDMAFMNYKGFSKSSDPYGTGNNIRQKNIDGSFDRGDRT